MIPIKPHRVTARGGVTCMRHEAIIVLQKFYQSPPETKTLYVHRKKCIGKNVCHKCLPLDNIPVVKSVIETEYIPDGSQFHQLVETHSRRYPGQMGSDIPWEYPRFGQMRKQREAHSYRLA